MFRRAVLVLASIAACLTPSIVYAGGLEYVAPGTRAIGRGGAFAARADDPTALRYNPAALAFLPSYQLSVDVNLAFYDACVQRSGGYDDSGVSSTWFYETQFGIPDPADPNSYASMSFPRICRSGPPGPSPQVLMSMNLAEGLGIAFGILAPAGLGTSTFGNGDGTFTVDGQDLPSPVRYQVVDQAVTLFWPSLGVGYSPIPEVSFGATFMWGIALVDFTTMTNSGTFPEDPGNDARARLMVQDWFVPGAILSVHVRPIDQLDIVASARFSDAIDASGSIEVTTGVFGTAMPGSLRPSPQTFQGAGLRAGQPWEFGLSIRYADRIRPRSRNPERVGRLTGRVEDPMQNENWDLELDVVYYLNSQVTDFVTRTPDDRVGLCEGDRDCATDGFGGLEVRLPPIIPIAKGWQDQVSIRLGGDYNVLPGILALRGGASFETSGMNDFWQGPDFMPGMRLGLHLGATLRVERFDFSIAYSHIFQFDHTVTDENARLRHTSTTGGNDSAATWTCRDAAGDPAPYDQNQPVVQRNCYPAGFGSVVNAGVYSAELNVLSATVRYHFE